MEAGLLASDSLMFSQRDHSLRLPDVSEFLSRYLRCDGDPDSPDASSAKLLRLFSAGSSAVSCRYFSVGNSDVIGIALAPNTS